MLFDRLSYRSRFSGDETDFFSVCNYQNYAFITNNVDRVMYYDGIALRFLNTNLSTSDVVYSLTSDISTCLFVEVNRERLELIAPVVLGQNQLATIYWSVAGDPLDFTNNEFLTASTSQAISTYKIINTDQIVSFSNSQRVFRYTGDAFSPFRWDTTNVVWRCDSSFGSINYDTYFSTVGRPGIVASDGVNIKRLDELIPDFTNPFRIEEQTPALYLDQTYIAQCYGERFDDLKEGWMCYPSILGTPTNVSDAVLAYNYEDETYAVYTFPFSCLGFGQVAIAETWGTAFDTWGESSDRWKDFDLEAKALVNLAGDQFGNIFQVDTSYTMGKYRTGTITNVGNSATANVTSTAHGLSAGDRVIIQGVVHRGSLELNNVPFVVTVVNANVFRIPLNTSGVGFQYISGGTWFTEPVVTDIITKDFNPFVEEGQLARLGYIDFLVSANDTTNVRIQFYANNELTPLYNTYYQESSINLASATKTKIWKRIYVGAVAQAHTLRIYQNYQDFSYDTVDQPISIHAIVPYFKAAGRIYQ